MRVVAQLKDLNSDTCKRIIVRNLSRIMDIRILDIDTESRTLSFLYENITAYEKAKRELYSIGYPILKYTYQEHEKRINRIDYLKNTI